MIKAWYHGVESPVRSDYLSINGYGIQEPMPPCIVDRPNGSGDFLIMFFFDDVDLRVTGEVTHLAAGTLMVWQPGSYQYYGNLGKPFLHSWIHCEGALVKHLVSSCGVALDTPLAGMSGPRFEHHIAAVHFECTQPVPPDRRIVESAVSCLLYDIQRSVGAPSSPAAIPEELLAARVYIDSHYASAITLSQLARIANLSSQHFCSRFRKAFGVAPIAYLIRVRLAQASYLLLDRNMRIGEIARRVGIGDVYYFSRLFKRRFGQSPSKMRV